MKQEMHIAYYVIRKGFGYWQPTKAMRELGFSSTPCGKDGPSAWAKAEQCNNLWQARTVPEAPSTTGYVYFLKAGAMVKIGFSTNPFARAGAFKTGMGSKIDRVVAIRGTLKAERQIHDRFAAYRKSGEWFSYAPVIEKAMMRAAALGTIESIISGTKLE